MASVIEVVTGISQAIHAKHEGGAEFGLSRESEALLQGVSIYDPRVMDGFGVQFQGDMLILKYHSEFPMVKVHDKNFETEVRRTVKAICDHIKEEYKKVRKESLRLTEIGDIQILVQSANRRTCYVNAAQTYKIGNFKMEPTGSPHKTVDDSEQTYADIAKRWLMGVRK
jgi:hypothetical protein